jgi:hypothetical protein
MVSVGNGVGKSAAGAEAATAQAAPTANPVAYLEVVLLRKVIVVGLPCLFERALPLRRECT